MSDIRILTGDCRALLRTLPDRSVHCVVTSPPYLGLRDYGVDGQIGLEATVAEHMAILVDLFREVRRVLRDDGTLLGLRCAGVRDRRRGPALSRRAKRNARRRHRARGARHSRRRLAREVRGMTLRRAHYEDLARRSRAIALSYRDAESSYRNCAAQNPRAAAAWLERAKRQAFYAETHESAAETYDILAARAAA